MHGQLYTDNTLYTILPVDGGPRLKALCGLFNSKLLRYIYQELAQEKGKTLAQVKVKTVNELPICSLDEDQQADVEILVDQILDAKDANPDADTSDLEREIDQLVYDLYGLTEEEIAAVERRVGVGRG